MTTRATIRCALCRGVLLEVPEDWMAEGWEHVTPPIDAHRPIPTYFWDPTHAAERAEARTA